MTSQPPWDEPPSYQPYVPQQPPSGLPYPPQPGYGLPPVYRADTSTNSMAIASLVCSLVGMGCGVGALLGVIFGHIAQSQIKRTGERGGGLALAGVIIGYVVLAIVIAYLVLVIALAASGELD